MTTDKQEYNPPTEPAHDIMAILEAAWAKNSKEIEDKYQEAERKKPWNR